MALAEFARILADEFRLGVYDEVQRRVRHLTAEGLLWTVGGAHRGSGRKRIYPESMLAIAAILLQLHRLGVTVPLMRCYMASLWRDLMERTGGAPDLRLACKGLQHPAIGLTLPTGDRCLGATAFIVDRSCGIKGSYDDADIILISLRRFLS